MARIIVPEMHWAGFRVQHPQQRQLTGRRGSSASSATKSIIFYRKWNCYDLCSAGMADGQQHQAPAAPGSSSTTRSSCLCQLWAALPCTHTKLREQQSVGPCLPALQGLHLGNMHCSQPWHAVLGSWMLLCCAMLSSLWPITSCDVTAGARRAAAPAVLVHICTVLLGTQQPCTHPCPTVSVLQGVQFICIKLSYILLHPI